MQVTCPWCGEWSATNNGGNFRPHLLGKNRVRQCSVFKTFYKDGISLQARTIIGSKNFEPLGAEAWAHLFGEVLDMATESEVYAALREVYARYIGSAMNKERARKNYNVDADEERIVIARHLSPRLTRALEAHLIMLADLTLDKDNRALKNSNYEAAAAILPDTYKAEIRAGKMTLAKAYDLTREVALRICKGALGEERINRINFGAWPTLAKMREERRQTSELATPMPDQKTHKRPRDQTIDEDEQQLAAKVAKLDGKAKRRYDSTLLRLKGGRRSL